MGDNFPGVEVQSFTEDTVINLICQCRGIETEIAQEKAHLKYLNGYLKKIEAKTIVFEPTYTDRDYLEDYSEYYVRCFDKYDSRCSRLHFFGSEFDLEQFRNAVTSQDETLRSSITNAYLGFIVAKPLPRTFIGRTCLKVYPEQDGRKYPVIREYTSHLFGLSLKVRSLAFQEQDTIASACATSALWSAFQGTGMLFHHEIPSPVSITKAATQTVPHLGRYLPSKGLTSVQMAAAVKAEGLEPEVIGAGNASLLKATAYAYLRARLPILMIAEVLDYNDQEELSSYYGNENQHAFHAVAVTGFRRNNEILKPYPELGTLLISDSLTQLYVHDDQVGPFARLPFTDKTYQNKSERELPLMNTTWISPNPTGKVRFAPSTLIVPLYHKIRIPFDTILQNVFIYDAMFESKRMYDPDILPQRLNWDVYLTTSGEWKHDISMSGVLAKDSLWKVLSNPFPRFLWRAVALNGNTPILEFLFDATDIEQGNYLFHTIKYQLDLANILLG